MAKKSRKGCNGASDEKFKQWGERFGKHMEKWGREFGAEMKEFGSLMRDNCGFCGNKKDEGFCTGIFGSLKPFINATVGAIVLAFFALIAIGFNTTLRVPFFLSLSSFIIANIPLFFAIFLFFGFAKYFEKRFPETFWVFAPVATTIGLMLVLWVAVWTLNESNLYIQNGHVSYASDFLYNNTGAISLFILALGYAIEIRRKFFNKR